MPDVVANHVAPATSIQAEPEYKQMDLFMDMEEEQKKQEAEKKAL